MHLPLLRTAHLVVGSLGLVAFVGSGLHMLLAMGGLQSFADAPRLFLRSAHIYLMWSALLNLMLGCHLTRFARGASRHVQGIASLAILVGPPLLALSFFTEPYRSGLARPLAHLAIFLAFGGALLHGGLYAVQAWRSKHEEKHS